MNTHHNARSFLLGVLTALLVVSLTTPALAAAGKMIEVFTDIRIYIDDVELHPTDAGGNPVDVFVYNGTTYLPVRAVSEALGKVVQWDGKTRSVYIGKHSSNTPAAYLSEMDYFSSAGAGSWYFGDITKDNLGNEHSYSIRNSNAHTGSNITYKLNGQYTRLTALYYQQYNYRSDDQDSPHTLIISGDGRELWHGSVGGGFDPINIDIDITGVLELKLEYANTSHGEVTAIGDAALWA